jgi:putative ABC transport system permease protein
MAALAGNTIRTLLTLLGIVVGVACVVSMAAVGEGARSRVAEQIKAFGANVLIVNPAQMRQDGVSGGRRRTLSEGDAEALASLSTIERAAGSVYGSAQVVAGARNWSTTVNGTTADHFAIREWSLAEGRMFSPGEEASGDKVAILGRTVAAKLFDGEDCVGQIVRIMDAPFTVIGVLGPKGASPGGDDQDDALFVPLSAARLRLIGSAGSVNPDFVAYILASAVSDKAMETAMDDARDLLRQRHRIDGGEDDFTVSTAASILAAQRSSARTIALLLGSVAAISLLVGGISIMNIMLVSVTERTKEIGLRTAIGARPRDVRRQFLCEAIALGLAGGALGVALGAGGACSVAKAFGWPIVLDPPTSVAAIGLAAAFGAIFGWYPAWRASNLPPVVALRA